MLTNWICLKCGRKWTTEEGPDPRYCPSCGSPTIMELKEKK